MKLCAITALLPLFDNIFVSYAIVLKRRYSRYLTTFCTKEHIVEQLWFVLIIYYTHFLLPWFEIWKTLEFAVLILLWEMEWCVKCKFTILKRQIYPGNSLMCKNRV